MSWSWVRNLRPSHLITICLRLLKLNLQLQKRRYDSIAHAYNSNLYLLISLYKNSPHFRRLPAMTRDSNTHHLGHFNKKDLSEDLEILQTYHSLFTLINLNHILLRLHLQLITLVINLLRLATAINRSNLWCWQEMTEATFLAIGQLSRTREGSSFHL